MVMCSTCFKHTEQKTPSVGQTSENDPLNSKKLHHQLEDPRCPRTDCPQCGRCPPPLKCWQLDLWAAWHCDGMVVASGSTVTDLKNTWVTHGRNEEANLSLIYLYLHTSAYIYNILYMCMRHTYPKKYGLTLTQYMIDWIYEPNQSVALSFPNLNSFDRFAWFMLFHHLMVAVTCVFIIVFTWFKALATKIILEGLISMALNFGSPSGEASKEKIVHKDWIKLRLEALPLGMCWIRPGKSC